MGQKVNPTGFRLPVNRAWRSRWFAPKKAFADFLVEDQKIRAAVKKRFVEAALSRPPSRRCSSSATPTACA